MPASNGSIWSSYSLPDRDQAGLDPQHVERVEAERCEAEVCARPPRRRPRRRRRRSDGRRSRTRARPCSRSATRRSAFPAPRRCVPTRNRNHASSSIVGWGPGVQTNRWRISRLFGPCTAMLCSCSIDGFTCTLTSPRRSACSFSQMPDGIVACHEPEVVLAEAEDRALVDHAAVVVADRRVDDLAHGKASRVARDHRLREGLRVGAEHLELPQGREVHDRRPLATRPVLGDRALAVEVARQPVARVLDDVAGERLPARLERRLLREHRRRRRGSRDARSRSRSVCSGP